MRRLFCVALLAAGCYSPNPPAGAYRCSSADQACPSGQHCTCGLCVNSDDQAACTFSVTAGSNMVSEHQQFNLTVQALMSDGRAASSFNGTVTLSSSWGDVRPASIKLSGGKASASVSLNRETLPPQTAVISATFAGNKGTSGKIAVAAQSLTRDANPIAPPATATMPYAFADVLVAQPNLMRVGNAWRMYFGGYSGRRGSYSFGYATSNDGVSFTPAAMPIFDNGGATFDKGLIESPAAFPLCSGSTYLAFEAHALAQLPSDNVPGFFGVASSSDGTSPFTLASNMPVLGPMDCGYCGHGLAFPSVIKDPAAAAVDGGCGDSFIMFFSATDKNGIVTIGRAESTDGVHFTPEPAPLLSGELTGEAVLLSPRVIVDGTVFKMFYSFARLADFRNGDLCQSSVGVGYATSSDGFYWIRSPSNPVMQAGLTGWDKDVTAFLVGSVVPTDGKDPQNGIAMYYSTFRHLTIGTQDQCLPNGIGRATRP